MSDVRDYKVATMSPEFDFSKGVRGKFFKPDAELRLPVFLDQDIQRYLVQRSPGKRASREYTVDLLKRDIAMKKSVK